MPEASETRIFNQRTQIHNPFYRIFPLKSWPKKYTLTAHRVHYFERFCVLSEDRCLSPPQGPCIFKWNINRSCERTPHHIAWLVAIWVTSEFNIARLTLPRLLRNTSSKKAFSNHDADKVSDTHSSCSKQILFHNEKSISVLTVDLHVYEPRQLKPGSCKAWLPHRESKHQFLKNN